VNEILWTLLQPSAVLVLLVALALIASWLRWHAVASTLLTAFLLVVAAVVLLPVNEWLGSPLETRVADVALPARADGIVVLGGAVDWRVTRERGQLSLNAAGERIAAAAALAQRYPEARLIVTGSFADAFADDLRADPSDASLFFGPHFGGGAVTYLGASRSTYEDALLTLAEAEPRQGETWLLVTSAWHMPRALGTFRAAGWSLLPVPVDYRTTGELHVAPDWDVAATLADLDRLVREWGAIAVYRREGRMVEPASEP
jgi:uncharacterized SAM-binding protein YcdF (DUF218 family)